LTYQTRESELVEGKGRKGGSAAFSGGPLILSRDRAKKKKRGDRKEGRPPAQDGFSEKRKETPEDRRRRVVCPVHGYN